MFLYGIKNMDINNLRTDIYNICENLGIDCFIGTKSNNCFKIKLLRLKNNKYQRTGNFYSENLNRYNKVNSVCWHGFRDFIKAVYELNENFRFVTATTTYKNKDHFLETYPATGNKNIGSIFQPMYFQEACLCD